MAEGRQLTKYHILLTKNRLSLRLTLLRHETYHPLVSLLEDGRFPEFILFPYFAVEYFRAGIEQLLTLFIVPVECEDQSKQTSDDKDIPMLGSSLENALDNSPAAEGLLRGTNCDLVLPSVLLNKEIGKQTVQVVPSHLLLQNRKLLLLH